MGLGVRLGVQSWEVFKHRTRWGKPQPTGWRGVSGVGGNAQQGGSEVRGNLVARGGGEVGDGGCGLDGGAGAGGVRVVLEEHGPDVGLRRACRIVGVSASAIQTRVGGWLEVKRRLGFPWSGRVRRCIGCIRGRDWWRGCWSCRAGWGRTSRWRISAVRRGSVRDGADLLRELERAAADGGAFAAAETEAARPGRAAVCGCDAGATAAGGSRADDAGVWAAGLLLRETLVRRFGPGWQRVMSWYWRFRREFLDECGDRETADRKVAEWISELRPRVPRELPGGEGVGGGWAGNVCQALPC